MCMALLKEWYTIFDGGCFYDSIQEKECEKLIKQCVYLLYDKLQAIIYVANQLI